MQNVDAGKYKYIVNTGVIFKNLQNAAVSYNSCSKQLKGPFFNLVSVTMPTGQLILNIQILCD